jgi:hypothetical protein
MWFFSRPGLVLRPLPRCALFEFDHALTERAHESWQSIAKKQYDHKQDHNDFPAAETPGKKRRHANTHS